jgi:hypothetical protein
MRSFILISTDYFKYLKCKFKMSSWWNSPICVTQKSVNRNELIANYNEIIVTCKKLQDNLVKIQTIQQAMLNNLAAHREQVIKKKHFTS